MADYDDLRLSWLDDLTNTLLYNRISGLCRLVKMDVIVDLMVVYRL